MLTPNKAYHIMKKLYKLAYTYERYNGGYPDEQRLADDCVKEIIRTLLSFNI